MFGLPQWKIDSHVHLDLVAERQPECPAQLRRHGCSTISWAFGENIASVEDLKRYLRRQSRMMEKLHAQSRWGCFFLAGIHPRNIPGDLRLDAVPDLLRPFLKHPLCLGLGEIGLETGAPREVDIFMAQLELARTLKEADLRIGVHTPRNHKTAITLQTLSILDAYSDLRPILVMDHCSAETLPLVLDRQLVAGVTLSPPKTSLNELARMLAARPDATPSILCNTDSCEAFYEDLFSAASSQTLSEHARNTLFRENAARFFGLKIDNAGVVVRGNRR